MDVRVTCTVKAGGTHESISHVGGYGWILSAPEVITAILKRMHTFYVVDPVYGKRSDVGVVQAASGEYLRTHADGYWNNNLLALGQCSR